MKTWIGFYKHFEARTGAGQVINFTADPDSGEAVKELLAKSVKNIYFPTTQCGGNLPSRYDIEQHAYGGGDGDCGGSYIEVLHIKDAPDGRCPFVVHLYSYKSPGGMSSHTFSEWKTLEDAIMARKNAGRHNQENCEKLDGFIRFVDCSELTPWFYAIGNQMLIRDFAVHSGFEEHPVYRLGKRFMITSEDGTVRVATCMGARQYSYQEPRTLGGPDKFFYWVVMFSDGSNLHLDANDVDKERQFFGNTKKRIQALPEGEVWQVDLLMQFWSLISGKKLGGIIKFEDGSSLVMKYQPKGKRPPDAPGKYLLKVTRKSGTTDQGWIDYDPEKHKGDSIVDAVLKATPKVNPEDPYEAVEVKKRDGDVSKKWLGIWHKLPEVLKD
ncbi:hypothetical protein H7X65_03835 [Candidatus Parcubacteria bacterium]|nr:hypothetical protein [Candidatus Parcubacteria bacterium]